jgi:hypothetical protein
MKQDEIIEMAKQAARSENSRLLGCGIDDLEAFAKLIADKAFQNGYEKGVAAFNDAVLLEREACAKVCEDLPAPDPYSNTDMSTRDVTCISCATAIRARGQA